MRLLLVTKGCWLEYQTSAIKEKKKYPRRYKKTHHLETCNKKWLQMSGVLRITWVFVSFCPWHIILQTDKTKAMQCLKNGNTAQQHQDWQDVVGPHLVKCSRHMSIHQFSLRWIGVSSCNSNCSQTQQCLSKDPFLKELLVLSVQNRDSVKAFFSYSQLAGY